MYSVPNSLLRTTRFVVVAGRKPSRNIHWRSSWAGKPLTRTLVSSSSPTAYRRRSILPLKALGPRQRCRCQARPGCCNGWQPGGVFTRRQAYPSWIRRWVARDVPKAPPGLPTSTKAETSTRLWASGCHSTSHKPCIDMPDGRKNGEDVEEGGFALDWNMYYYIVFNSIMTTQPCCSSVVPGTGSTALTNG